MRTKTASKVVVFCGLLLQAAAARTQVPVAPARDTRVYARFDLRRPDTGPFPSDAFTVEDATQATGRRVNYPLPDCLARPTDCEDLAMVNTLDGWGLQPRIAVPFTNDVDPATLNSQSVFLIALSSTDSADLPGGSVIGLNQTIWDPASHTFFAESDAVLDQHRAYALVVTDAVHDPDGKAVKASSEFRSLNANKVPQWYQDRLAEAIAAARDAGIENSAIISASVFTTQSITPVMERIRNSIKADTPAPADFNLGLAGQRTVFPRSQVANAIWQRQTSVTPPLTPMTINLPALNVVPGAVGTIAYGRYSSPEYLVHPGEYIPAVGTLGAPTVQAINTIYFTLYLPAGSRPPTGWPIAILSGGSSTNKHASSTLFAAEFAKHGIAAIGINHVGQGFGPLTMLQINKTDGSSLVFPDAGRAVDQDGDGVIGQVEGSRAAPPRTWTIAERDAFRQTIIDFMQLVRVIEVGMDVDGDSQADFDPSRIYFVGASQGSMIATIFLALEPDVHVGAGAFVTGVIPEHLRWQVARRGTDIGDPLQKRTPSLLNAADGLTSIDGVPVAAGPFFNENKPLRDQPLVINNVPGAIAIQEALEFSEMVSQAGLSPALWSKHLLLSPLPGVQRKSVMYLNAKGDRSAVNPGTTALLRAGQLTDRAIFFRTDLAIELDMAFPREPHAFTASTGSADLFLRAVALSAQDAIGAFLESDGVTITQPTPASLFELPIAGPLPEALNYIFP